MSYDLSSATVGSIRQATDDAIATAESLIDTAVNAASPTYASTIVNLDEAIKVIGDASGYGPFLMNCHSDPEVREAGANAKERLDKWLADLVFRSDVFSAVEAVDESHLDGLALRSVTMWKRDLDRAGHRLQPADRSELQELRQRLIELEVAFARNLSEFDDGIDVPAESLDGLPESYIESLRDGTTAGTKRISLDYPEYQPFMQQARDRDLRRQLQHKNYNQAVAANRPLLEEAISIRHRIAELLGYATWADHQMEVKMADPESVAGLYSSIVPGLTEKALDERAALQELLAADHPGATLSVWDWTYYDTQQAKSEFGVDQNEVAAYFPLEATIDGMFDITGTVFGLRYEVADDLPAWHDDVRGYRIYDRDTGRPIAEFFLDLHPRDGKFTHAACWSLRKGCREEDGSYRLPLAAVLANFTKPTESDPSLLRHDEALTLFHEFGHVLHECLTTVEVARFAGYDTEWDFVEAPSQIMENWMWHPDVLNRFAAHHRSGEPLPDDLLDGLVRLRDHNIALKLLRQCYYGTLDLDFHTGGPEPDLGSIDRAAHHLTQLPFHEDTFFAAGFGHLMGGYDAGYYGYLWSMVYGDDMFSVFEEQGVMSPEVGARYRSEVLEPGFSRDAIDHLRAFLGREPNEEAFMKKIGLSA